MPRPPWSSPAPPPASTLHAAVGALNTAEVEAMLPRIREHVKIPVGVGFGIRDADTARAIGQVADAVVIGSRLIQVIENQPHERVAAAATDFLRSIRAALDA